MPSTLAVPRCYIRTINSQLYNSFSQQSKEISLTKTRQKYRNCKDLIISFFSFLFYIFYLCLVPMAMIPTLLLFIIKLPSYIERYSR